MKQPPSSLPQHPKPVLVQTPLLAWHLSRLPIGLRKKVFFSVSFVPVGLWLILYVATYAASPGSPEPFSWLFLGHFVGWALLGLALTVGLLVLLAFRWPPKAKDDFLREQEAKSRDLELFVQENSWLILIAVLAGGFGIASVLLFVLGWSFGPLTALDPKILAQGKAPTSLNVRVEGRLLLSEALTRIEYKEASYRVHYIPLVSKDWKPSQTIELVLESHDILLQKQKGAWSKGPFGGLLFRRAFPPSLRRTLAERGLSIPRVVWRLDYTRDRSDFFSLGAALGVWGLLFAALFGFLKRRKARKKEREA